MADRAEMFSLSTFHSLSPPGCRPSHDISLEEFDDEDLSEITDDCGIGLNYDSDPYEKDCLILEKSEFHHPVCSFQDDFQEFEMIDDEDEEENEDEEEVPPSPSASPPPSPSLKSRPTTLNLTSTVSQDSLNNNGHGVSPRKSSWQDSLRNQTSQGRHSPTHSCLEDSSHVTGSCPAIAPGNTAPAKGTPPTQAQSPGRPLLYDFEGNRRERPEYGSFGQHKSCGGGGGGGGGSDTCDFHAESDAPLAEESQCSDTEVDHALNGRCRPCGHSRNTTANDTYTITTETLDEPDPDNDMTLDGTSKCLSSTAPLGPGEEGEEDGSQTPLSDAELDRVFDGDDYTAPPGGGGYVEFPCIEHSEAASFSSYVSSSSHSERLPEADRHNNHHGARGPPPPPPPPAPANDSTSPSSDPGIADMNTQHHRHRYGGGTDRHSDDLSSPGSDSDVEEELEAAFVACHMISSISETELDLSSDSSSGRSSHLTNSIEEASSPTSDPEMDPELDAEQDSGIVGLKAPLLLGQLDPIKPHVNDDEDNMLPLEDGQALMGLQREEAPREEDGYQGGYHQADPDETLPPAEPCEDKSREQLVLRVEPDHSLESFKRSFYLPVSTQQQQRSYYMPHAEDYPNSEGESESESEDELSENSDSPWLLSNLVNKMISEGSYPISCPEECLKRSASLSDTISPSTPHDLLEVDMLAAEAEEEQRRRETQGGSDNPGDEPPNGGEGEMAKTTDGRQPQLGRVITEGTGVGVCLYMSNPTCDTVAPLILERYERPTPNLTPTPSLTSSDDDDDDDDEEPDNDRRMERSRAAKKELDSPSQTDSVASDKDDGPEIKVPATTATGLQAPSTGAPASLQRITEVKNSLTLDLPTTVTNRVFSLSYSTDEEVEEGSPFLDVELELGLTSPQVFFFLLSTLSFYSPGSYSYLDSSPPIDESVRPHPLARPMRPPLEPSLADSLAYDSMKYTLVVDENTTLELVSLKRCTSLLSEHSESEEEEDEEGQVPVGYSGLRGPPLLRGSGGVRQDLLLTSSSEEDSSPEADMPFSKKFLNVFVKSTSRSSKRVSNGTESFGLFSCTINGEEREQTHRAVFRFIPRHADELELDVDDPLLVEQEEDDYWYRGYNMRTGATGIFPAYYAHELISHNKDPMAVKRNPAWIETFGVQFLGSVEVPYHQGSGILCAAMQKIARSRKRTVHVRPPSVCELEISLQGIKLIMSLEEDYDMTEEFDRCSHFFQMKNISFCGCHPKNNCYFGFITKHPMLNRFACHVFVSQESMRGVAECVGRAFQEYYQEHLEFACPTEDIYLE
ncbi:C-Jun-amino-terminal kinase-interacting protein 2 [Engraulis encrasicolus]|uniref:C-Jun-amino-terminal kinase-interacting protein 2 n=1 Tax=Engraulis encrasicolus TaxID=184585 RepID=UPI002FD1AA9E